MCSVTLWATKRKIAEKQNKIGHIHPDAIATNANFTISDAALYHFVYYLPMFTWRG